MADDIVERLPCGCLDKPGWGHNERCPTLVALTHPDGRPKIAPVQGYSPGIPWSLQLEAYDAYRAKWSPQPAMIDLDRRGCRGGFSVGELDEFVPGWRDRVSEITALRSEASTLRERVKKLEDAANEALGEVCVAMAFLGRGPGGVNNRRPKNWAEMSGQIADRLAPIERLLRSLLTNQEQG
jgi:hypothetical protein